MAVLDANRALGVGAFLQLMYPEIDLSLSVFRNDANLFLRH
jgi:hypothetical protein